MLTWHGSEKIYRLKPETADSLKTGMTLLWDDLLETLTTAMSGGNVQGTSLYAMLPQRYRDRLNAVLCRDFIIALDTLALKVLGPEPALLGCVAEEMLLHWTVEQAKAAREGEERSDFEDLDAYFDGVMEDTDFLTLYDPALDGIDDMEDLGMASLRFRDWFLPFCEGRVTNPLAWPERTQSQGL